MAIAQTGSWHSTLNVSDAPFRYFYTPPFKILALTGHKIIVKTSLKRAKNTYKGIASLAKFGIIKN